MSNKRVWVYCRIAHGDKMSIELQRQRLVSYAEEKGYQVVGISSDTGTGLSMKRRGWNEVETAVFSGQADAVLTANVSRISRNTKMIWECVDRFNRRNVEVLTLDNGKIEFCFAALYMRMAKKEA